MITRICHKCNKEKLLNKFRIATRNRKNLGYRYECKICFRKYDRKHRETIKGHLRVVWEAMKSRCYYSKNNRYDRYGGRGIKVCDKWLNFGNFFVDMAPLYKKGLTLDRINNNGNYEPSNCKWATKEQQCSNRSSNHLIEYKGIIDTMKHWANYLGFNVGVLSGRLVRRNWDIERALFQPHRKDQIACKRGHLLTLENSYVYKNRRSCRTCRTQKMRNWHAKQLATRKMITDKPK